tara:strand:- start:166 stop:453 length:288 start_codon:yes stop_codon:yes gene_type:complete
MEFNIGDYARETYHGYVSHCEHHGKPKGISIDVNVGFMPGSVGLPIPRALWKPKKGKIIELRERWYFQKGHDALVKRENGHEEWRLADEKHLEVL